MYKDIEKLVNDLAKIVTDCRRLNTRINNRIETLEILIQASNVTQEEKYRIENEIAFYKAVILPKLS